MRQLADGNRPLTNPTNLTAKPHHTLSGRSRPIAGLHEPSSLNWLVNFTNPQGSYSIQYPTSFGQLAVEYDTQGATLTWDNPDYTDFLVFIGFYDASEQQWFRTHVTLTAPETIVVNGMKGTIYIDQSGNKRVFLTHPGTPMPYYIDFTCNGGTDCSLPPWWRQMLASFQVLK